MKWINDEALDEMDCIISKEISKDFINEYAIAKKIADFLEDKINDLYRNILSDQPNSVTCNNCGANLDISYTNVDGDNDLIIETSPCECVLNEN